MDRNISLDILKVIMAIFIVALHGNFLADYDPAVGFYLKNGLFRICVPIFLIISGFFFYNTKNFAQWVFRLAVLYVVWMLIYLPFWLQWPLNSWSVEWNFKTIFWGYNHLWYLIGTLLGGVVLYLLRNLYSCIQLSLAIALFGVGVAAQYIGNLHILSQPWDRAFNVYVYHRNFLTTCFPFMMLGFLLNKHQITIRQPYLSILLVLSLLILFLEVFFNYQFISKTESLDGMFALLLVCPLIFMCAKHMEVRSQLKTLAVFSTGLYLIHPLIQYLLKQNYVLNSVTLFGLTLFISTLMTMVLMGVNRKVKYLL